MHFKQDKMTPLERIGALFSRRTPDRVPLGAMSTGFNTRNAGYSVADAYNDPEKSFNSMIWTSEQYGWDPVPQYSGHTVLGAWDFGGRVRFPRGEYEGALVVESYPVVSEKDIETLKIPDPEKAGRIPQARRFSELQMEHGLPVYFFSRSPFSMAANICGLERFCRWLIKKPELCEQLMDIALKHILNVLEYWVELFGASRIFAWMSSPSESNQVISPAHMEKFALPYHFKYHEKLESLGIEHFGLHICGDQNHNLPFFADSPPWKHPSVLSFGHEVDIAKAGKLFPEDIIFGNIEPALIQTSTPQRIYALCVETIEKGKRLPGGFILGPGCGLPPTAPPANVYAMTKAVNEHGWY
ncbi:MAG TPA: hypothetical protein EYP19_09560 [Desulfobacterales bacterium]|nr:hypothetical protein [Desulfobacterales bacterium]